MRTCIYPGSFDPPTIGHVDIIRRGARLFDRVIVAVMDNGLKHSAFTPEERVALIGQCVAEIPGVEVVADGGLLVNVARRLGADAILRGLRGEADCGGEGQMAAVNRQLGDIETVFLFAAPQHSHLSSTVVREVARHGGSVAGMVPDEILPEIERKFA